MYLYIDEGTRPTESGAVCAAAIEAAVRGGVDGDGDCDGVGGGGGVSGGGGGGAARDGPADGMMPRPVADELPQLLITPGRENVKR